MHAPKQHQPFYEETDFQQFLLAQLEDLTYKIGRLEKHLIPAPPLISEMEKSTKGEFLEIDSEKGWGKFTCTSVDRVLGVGCHEWMIEYSFDYMYISPTKDKTIIQHGCKTCDFNTIPIKSWLHASWMEWQASVFP
jgi:hypothetical protein